jgi:hypothetical protein
MTRAKVDKWQNVVNRTLSARMDSTFYSRDAVGSRTLSDGFEEEWIGIAA